MFQYDIREDSSYMRAKILFKPPSLSIGEGNLGSGVSSYLFPKMRRLFPFFLFFLLLSPTAAIDDDIIVVDPLLYPTYALIQETELPPIDRFDLAQRLLHIDYQAPLNQIVPERNLGDIETLYINSTIAGQVLEVAFELRAIGDHVYIWIERNLPSSSDVLENLSHRFDTEIYEFVRSVWGSENSPGIDGETRIHIVITQQIREDLGGFFTSRNASPAAITPYSNERDILVLNARVLMPQFQLDILGTAAHEFQHLIRNDIDSNELTWMNEGFSTLTEHLLGFGTANPKMFEFAFLPQTQLNALGLGDNRLAEYGAAMLFMIYLYDRFGMEFIHSLSADPNSGLIAVNKTLQAFDAPSVDVIFADWVLANFLRQNDSIYAYRTVPNLPPMSLAEQANYNYPFSTARHLSQYSTGYFQFHNLPPSLTISLTLPDTIGLIPINASSGQMFWYSQRGDNSNPRLTRAFDLTHVDSAQLDYRIWYNLEADWDYAYLSVSSNNGRTWQLLSTPNMLDSNPNGRAYGIGYTGQSNTWLEQTVSLDAFAGQDILLRFEMLTDDALNQVGVALDDLRIDAIGYSSDFENDGDGWQSEGWIHTDNRLPQRCWVQVIEHQGTDFTVIRYLAQGNAAWILNIAPETEYITLAISPFAPMTTEKVAYELIVE
jgi:hypothetical protein